LSRSFTRLPVGKCRALDIGCGTGDNSIWLARTGFEITGTDTSDVALENAGKKAEAEGLSCSFLKLDFFKERVDGAPFGFAFDRGCFHSFGSDEERSAFAANVASHLADSGLWLTLAGNADEKRKMPGPPQRSARDIIVAVEPCFEVLALETTHFGSNHPTPPRAWRCLMRKRSQDK